MLKKIQDFFSQMIAPGLAGEQPSPHGLQVATAALLLEMMRMDHEATAAEAETICAVLTQQFGLQKNELDALVALAGEEAAQATDYFQFTSLINKAASPELKRQLMENLWRVALADGQVDVHENHLLRKIADLLYVPNSEYLAAKQRAQRIG